MSEMSDRFQAFKSFAHRLLLPQEAGDDKSDAAKEALGAALPALVHQP